MSICENNYNIANSKWEKPLSIKIDQKLNFNANSDKVWKKAAEKLNALLKQRMPVNIFFLSQFSYCL